MWATTRHPVSGGTLPTVSAAMTRVSRVDSSKVSVRLSEVEEKGYTSEISITTTTFYKWSPETTAVSTKKRLASILQANPWLASTVEKVDGHWH